MAIGKNPVSPILFHGTVRYHFTYFCDMEFDRYTVWYSNLFSKEHVRRQLIKIPFYHNHHNNNIISSTYGVLEPAIIAHMITREKDRRGPANHQAGITRSATTGSFRKYIHMAMDANIVHFFDVPTVRSYIPRCQPTWTERMDCEQSNRPRKFRRASKPNITSGYGTGK